MPASSPLGPMSTSGTSHESMALPNNATLSDAGGTSSTIGPRRRSKTVRTYGVWLLAVRNSWRGSITLEK